MRISPPDIEHVVEQVTQESFRADLKRGYCLIEVFPARDEILSDKRSGKSIVIHHDQAIMFQCMLCQFNIGDAPLAAKDGVRRTAKHVMEEHLRVGEHPWPFRPFTNPYGMDADATIDGIENYPAEIGGLI